MGDAVNTEFDRETPSQTSPNDRKLICGAQKVRNFIARLRRNSIAGEASARDLYVVERKISSGFCYKLKDEKSAVKTLWPVACREFIFLPEFKVKHADIEEQFEIVNYVAKGSFGKVYKVRKISHPEQQFALKVLEKSKIIVDDYVQQLKYEVLIQQAISHHPFIVTSHEHWQNKGFVFQLIDFITEGELCQRITHFTHKLIQLYVAELALVIDFLHNAGIVYRDLKSENILLDENLHVKLTDFGLSKWLKVGKRTFTICGTRSSMDRQINETLASIFHTVLFHRSLGKFLYSNDISYSVGTVGTQDVDCDFIDFTYVCCASASLDRAVRKEINSFSEQLRSQQSAGTGQISLEFFQKKKKPRFTLFDGEVLPWEVWTVRLDLLELKNEDERQTCRERVGDMLTDKLLFITDVMNRHDFVPKMPAKNEVDNIFDTTHPDVQPYLFKFNFSTSTGPATTSVKSTMQKIIKETLSL